MVKNKENKKMIEKGSYPATYVAASKM